MGQSLRLGATRPQSSMETFGGPKESLPVDAGQRATKPSKAISTTPYPMYQILPKKPHNSSSHTHGSRPAQTHLEPKRNNLSKHPEQHPNQDSTVPNKSSIAPNLKHSHRQRSEAKVHIGFPRQKLQGHNLFGYPYQPTSILRGSKGLPDELAVLWPQSPVPSLHFRGNWGCGYTLMHTHNSHHVMEGGPIILLDTKDDGPHFLQRPTR